MWAPFVGRVGFALIGDRRLSRHTGYLGIQYYPWLNETVVRVGGAALVSANRCRWGTSVGLVGFGDSILYLPQDVQRQSLSVYAAERNRFSLLVQARFSFQRDHVEQTFVLGKL